MCVEGRFSCLQKSVTSTVVHHGAQAAVRPVVERCRCGRNKGSHPPCRRLPRRMDGDVQHSPMNGEASQVCHITCMHLLCCAATACWQLYQCSPPAGCILFMQSVRLSFHPPALLWNGCMATLVLCNGSWCGRARSRQSLGCLHV
jgi:hypothetical protein